VKAQEIAALNELEVKKRSIQAIIGILPQPLIGVREDLLAQSPEPVEMEKWVEFAEQHSLVIALQDKL
jgi:outer membrane protein